MNFSVRSSRVTGPKIRVPMGSNLAFSNTAALPSNLTSEPSLRRMPLAVRTTTTLLNLQKWNFPFADRNHLYLKSNTSSKEVRRNIIEKQFNVILLVGDNLSDFDQVFEDRSVNFGYNTVDSLRLEIGKKFIILPNPMYGDWVKPLVGEGKGWLKTVGK